MPDLNNPSVSTPSRRADVERRWPYVCDPDLAFVTPKLRQLMQVWHAKRGAGGIPQRADFSLRDLSFAIPNIAIVSLVRSEAGARFRVLLMGNQLEAYVGSMTGMFIDEVLPTRLVEKWTSIWSGALRAGGPQRTAGRVEVGGKDYYVFETFGAPLLTEGDLPVTVLVATYFHAFDTNRPDADELGRKVLRDINALPQHQPSLA